MEFCIKQNALVSLCLFCSVFLHASELDFLLFMTRIDNIANSFLLCGANRPLSPGQSQMTALLRNFKSHAVESRCLELVWEMKYCSIRQCLEIPASEFLPKTKKLYVLIKDISKGNYRNNVSFSCRRSNSRTSTHQLFKMQGFPSVRKKLRSSQRKVESNRVLDHRVTDLTYKIL